MAIDDGFKDTRSATDLMLAPAQPAARTLSTGNSLKLGLGADAIPGVISSTKQITGAVRESLKKTLGFKTGLSVLSTGLSTVLKDFDKVQSAFNKGNVVQKDALFRTPTSTFPSAADFFNFSTLAPGQSVPASFKAVLIQRKQQLQGLKARISAAFQGAGSAGGVQVEEKTKRTTNPQEEQVDAPSTPALAQGGTAGRADAVNKDKQSFLVRGVNIATGKPGFFQRLLSAAHVAALPSINTVVNQRFKDTTNKGSWSEPASAYGAQYPYNKVQQTESGHVMEWDDTPSAERIHIFHRAGSFIEWHPDGTVVYKNMKHGYLLTMGDQFIKVSGNCHIAVDGDATIFAKKNVHVQSEQDVNIQAKGNFNVFAENVNLHAKGTVKADAIKIDLRYIKLPSGIMPYFSGLTPTGQFGPKIDLAAIHAEFPTFDEASAAKAPDGQRVAGFSPVREAFDVPPESPLANPFVYATKTPEATNYRIRLFDTPEEVANFEHYTAHIALQQTLEDLPTTSDPKALGGTLSTLTSPIVAPSTKPTVDLLNFDDYKGTFTYANTDVLGGTSFTIAELVDTNIHATVMAEDMSIPLPAPRLRNSETDPTPTPDPNDPFQSPWQQ
jgi:hypothetical protein